MSRFLLGINYWPRRSAMYMWERFDLGEIARGHGAHQGARARRRALLPYVGGLSAASPTRWTPQALRRFDAMMETIADAGLRAMPTLFCGHMSGVNWLPAWTLERATDARPLSHDRRRQRRRPAIGDFYADPELLRAQVFFARRVGERVRDHPALFAWDLGNEFSNLREPATPQDAAQWSARSDRHAARSLGRSASTGGMHGEDLDQDRKLRPSSIAAPWIFATMHGYSVYSAFARDRLDTNVVPFLCSCSSRSAASACSSPSSETASVRPGSNQRRRLRLPATKTRWPHYARGAIDRLHARGALGAFWWCWADYDPALAECRRSTARRTSCASASCAATAASSRSRRRWRSSPARRARRRPPPAADCRRSGALCRAPSEHRARIPRVLRHAYA